MIGDSTAANYASMHTWSHVYPLAGWGMFLQNHFDSRAVAVVDLAYPGRSSKSFYDEGRWQQAKASYVSSGDYVFIQFGHNDMPRRDPTRHTDPFTTFKHYLTLYINDTRAAMATPVLVTPISKAVWNTDGSFNDQSLGDYPLAMRQLAGELDVPLVDLNKDTVALFSKLGEKTTQNQLFMCLPPGKYGNYPKGDNDTTHLQETGAKQVALLAAQGVAKAPHLQGLHAHRLQYSTSLGI